jgi:hypothetical protein
VTSGTPPAIKIVNPNLDTTTGSTSRTWLGWLPIELEVGGTPTTRYIPIYQ